MSNLIGDFRYLWELSLKCVIGAKRTMLNIHYNLACNWYRCVGVVNT